MLNSNNNRQNHRFLVATCLLCIACLFLAVPCTYAQGEAKIEAEELIYNFGTIGEADGMVTHIFTIKNSGEQPLVINRITASCGCTKPEWTKEPIAPGRTGEVKVTYNPKGRPGPFYKTISIYSNGKKGSFSLGIKGNVTPKEQAPIPIYPYNIGALKMSSKNLLFNAVRIDEIAGQKIQLKNEESTSLLIHVGKTPNYLNVTAPEKLEPGAEGEINILVDAAVAKRKGRLTAELPLSIEVIGKKGHTEGKISIGANVIDNFTHITTADRQKAPVAALSGTLLNFGKVQEKNSIIPLVGQKVSGTFEITNKGKTELQLYSITCDDERVSLTGGKRTLKPGASCNIKVTLHPREIQTRLEALIHVVCNDPNGPVRYVKVVATSHSQKEE